MIPQYNTKLFTDIWSSEDVFRTDLQNSPFVNCISSNNITILYYLLYAKYGNSPIANFDEEQFKMKVFGLTFQFGPSWEKKLDIQSKLRGLTEEEVVMGLKTINNHSFNPSTEPSTSSQQELDTINEQNTSMSKRSKLEAYGMLWDLIATDVTGPFIERFKVCFKQFVLPEHIALYEDLGD